MRLVPVLALILSVAACDKKSDSGAGGTTGEREKGSAADPAKPAVAPKDEKPEPVAKAEPTPPKEPAKPTKTGILDLELQEVEGGYKILSPRYSMQFASKPEVQRQDAQTPFGDTIPGAVAVVEGGDRFAGLIYIPIPKDLPYDVPKGLKGARDGMLGMFDGKYDAKDDKQKLGDLEANHVVAEGSREGHKFHVEAWIAFDEKGRTVYGLMSLRMPTDLEGIDKLPGNFVLRPDAAAPVEDDKASAKKGGDAKKPAPAKKDDPY